MLQIFQRATPSNKRRKLNTKNIKSAAVLKLASTVSDSRAQQSCAETTTWNVNVKGRAISTLLILNLESTMAIYKIKR